MLDFTPLVRYYDNRGEVFIIQLNDGEGIYSKTLDRHVDRLAVDEDGTVSLVTGYFLFFEELEENYRALFIECKDNDELFEYIDTPEPPVYKELADDVPVKPLDADSILRNFKRGRI